MVKPAAGSLDHERLELALQSARLGDYEWDMVADVVRISPRMSEISGLPAGEWPADQGDFLYRGVHPDDRERTRRFMEDSMRAHGRFETEYRRIREDDGRTVWMRTSGLLVHDDEGRAIRAVGVTQDVGERHAEEDRRRALMAELDHRVKNVLAAVQALAVQTAKRTTSLDSFLSTFSGRLKAMASANELLTAARWRGAAIAHLAAAELGGIAPGQARWEGPELFLTPRAANALSLALHELATNAVKYGALSVETGRVDVRWTRIADGGFELFWNETGGPPVLQPTHKGFGTTLLSQVTGRELNGEAEVEYRRAGASARLRAGPAAVVSRPDTVPEAPAPRKIEATPAAQGSTDLRGKRVLIVEDAVLLALELETGLSEAGALVVGPAYELEEAMNLLGSEIDAAVLDANLNGLSVTPVAEALAARGVPFVFATGYGDSGAPMGFDAPIIRKPYDVTQVAAAVAGLFSHR
ncbi:histidine kinase [Phenylobacterium sp. Root77]|jgi:PAS domain S-box-containing protein|uniref:HWE histidine kinase domain-containing protein n=1 Tax=unclassified Phenylobacterium TaxID=2640670 RepID=UPI0006FD5E54|nr:MULTISPECIES: HWE histidine kinase domain-containing protein [unclassified Phenylobacterium]KQW73489.1 histidine kinase [Phenylobacterium sp. Root1277]KQW92708.1 histidine kinase [Phenylobacterium sp. Root1290]KRC40936.1 histidine kinase [Phenylobacterium sp. Root77]